MIDADTHIDVIVLFKIWWQWKNEQIKTRRVLVRLIDALLESATVDQVGGWVGW